MDPLIQKYWKVLLRPCYTVKAFNLNVMLSPTLENIATRKDIFFNIPTV